MGLWMGSAVFLITLGAGMWAGRSFSTLTFWSAAGFLIFYLVGAGVESGWRRISTYGRDEGRPVQGSNVDFVMGAEIPGMEGDVR